MDARPVLSTPAKSFIAGITKGVDGLLQRPMVHKRRVKQLPPDFVLRRSSRLKNKRGTPASTISQTWVNLMHRLDLVEEHETIGEQELESYFRIFEKPLSQAHIAALTTLFGWHAPSLGKAPWDVAIFPSVATGDL